MKRLLQVSLFLMMALVLVGCGGNATSTTPTASLSDEESAETGDVTTNRASEAAGDNFRADPASWVGNSGSPQLVEVFSYD